MKNNKEHSKLKELKEFKANLKSQSKNSVFDTDNSSYKESIENDAVESADSTNSNLDKHRFKPNNNYFTIMIYGLLFVLFSILIYRFICNFKGTLSFLGSLIKLISPFIVGAFIALVLYPLVHFLYNKLFAGLLKIKSQKTCKWLSILFAYLIAIGFITILMFFVAPQIYKSLSEITDQLPIWYQTAIDLIHDFENNHSNWTFIDYDAINQKIESAYPMVMDYLSGIMANLLPVVLNTSMAIIKGIMNFIISIMVSVYMIADYKNLFYQFKRFLYAVMPKAKANTTRNIIHESGNIFLSFIFGKALDSLIIGILCFIFMLILKLPYAVLISVMVAVTNMIPYFGPFIGGFMGGIILIIVNPIKVIVFAILILILQQFDGLFLGPKILGDKTGLKPLWVIFAITVGGSLFGVLGMFLGVPVLAVLSYILNLIIQHLLNKRKITVTPYKSDDIM